MDKKIIRRDRFKIWLAVVVSLVFLLVSIIIKFNKPTEIKEKGIWTESFKSLPIKAHSVIGFDIKNKKILFEKNPEIIRPLASITKVLTAIAVLEKFPNFNSERNIIEVSLKDIMIEGDSGLIVGEQFNLTDFIKFTLVGSSNDGANALGRILENGTTTAEQVLNNTARKIGLYNSYFVNPSGLDKNGLPQAYGTATDVAKLIAYAYTHYPEIFEATRYREYTMTSRSGVVHSAQNTNQVAVKTGGLKVSKTGFTESGGGNLAIVADFGIGREIAIVVLGSTYEDRFDDMIILENKVISSLGETINK